jgi:small GTP-binding protein
MSTKFDNVLKVFSKFLDDGIIKKGKIKTVEDILNLPTHSYKFLDKNEAIMFEELLGVNDISKAAKLDKNDPFKKIKNMSKSKDELKQELIKKIELLVDKFPDFEKHLKKTITISSIIASLSDGKHELDKTEQKVVVVGLDNAGKTALLTKFGKRLGIGDLAKLKPTKGISRQQIIADDLELIIWDFGGQAEYRKKYLSNPAQYFLQMNLLMYVIDVQDSERYDDSIEYFSKILDVLQMLEENPYIIVYIHKFDPEIKSEPEVLLNIELLKEKLTVLFQEKNLQSDYEIYLTSIFSLISNEPKFAKYIKEVMKSAHSLTDPTLKKVDGMGKILEDTMNAIIRLSESISLQISEIDHRLRAIESGAFQIAQSGIPIEIQNPEAGRETRQDMKRANVLDELKDLFQKQKRLEL